MASQQIDYGRLVEGALRRVVHDALSLVAEHGLPGRHHLYITFRTDHPGVELADELRARYPNDMTIVLQYEFWGLEVRDDGFGITLSFNNAPQRLEVPFEAISVFADPSVEFGLQFGVAAAGADGGTQAEERKPAEVTEMPEKTGDKPAAAEGSAEVVTLDRFRKK